MLRASEEPPRLSRPNGRRVGGQRAERLEVRDRDGESHLDDHAGPERRSRLRNLECAARAVVSRVVVSAPRLQPARDRQPVAELLAPDLRELPVGDPGGRAGGELERHDQIGTPAPDDAGGFVACARAAGSPGVPSGCRRAGRGRARAASARRRRRARPRPRPACGGRAPCCRSPHLPGQSETTPGSIGQKYSVSFETACDANGSPATARVEPVPVVADHVPAADEEGRDHEDGGDSQADLEEFQRGDRGTQEPAGSISLLGNASFPASRDRARLVGSLELLAVRKAISLEKQSFAWSDPCGTAKRAPGRANLAASHIVPRKKGSRA